jgi:SAM-dependent methyltransferase
LFAVLTCIPSDRSQRQLIAEISRVLRPGGLLLISGYPLQRDGRNRNRYESFHREFGVYGTFRLSDGGVVRHHPPEWFLELLTGFRIEERIELEAKTMDGNPARIVQFWARSDNNPRRPIARKKRSG